jgi:integrase
LERVKGETLPAGREITEGELIALVQACKRDSSPAGSWDAAILGVLYSTGLRRDELAVLDKADYDRETGKLTIRAGKGRKARTTYLAGGAKTALDVWLIERGMSDGALFTPVLKSGKRTNPADYPHKIQTGRRMTAQAVYNLLEKRGKQAGLADFSPHDFRRSMISTLLDIEDRTVLIIGSVETHRLPLKGAGGGKKAPSTGLCSPLKRAYQLFE